MENLIKVNVINKDGKLVVSSREIAENFGRRHDNVKRDLELILQSHSSNLRGEIVESTYVNRGKECKEYLLTEKGFTFICLISKDITNLNLHTLKSLTE